MCTLCQTLDPKIEEYDDHGIESLGGGSVSTTYQAAAQSSGDAGGLPHYSYGQIADYLTEGYWTDTGRDGRSFDVRTGDTLTVDLSGLDTKGATTARIALDAWSAASGLEFEEISSRSSASNAPSAVHTETTDVAGNKNTTTTLQAGEQFIGTIGTPQDKDWIAVELVKGQQYSITMAGDGAEGQINDTVLRLVNAQGQTLARNDDRSSGDRSSAIDFTATTTDTFYIEAAGYGTSNSGSYKLNISEGNTPSSADITFQDSNSGAYAFSTVRGNTILNSTINVDDSWSSNGRYYVQTFIHEVGHALGLGHSGDYNGSANFGSDAHYANDSWQTTVMSYFDQNENSNTDASRAYVASAQMADIVAIQNLYGTPANTHGGDSVYGEGQNVGQWGMGLGAGLAVTIHDTGGNDTINLANSGKSQTIDLNDGSFSSINGKVGNVGISVGTVIENATTGSGSDHITGNQANNVLSSGDGDDFLFGRAGNDTLDGGGGSDLIDGGAGFDTVINDAAMAKFNIIYDAQTSNGNVLKIQDAKGAIDTLRNVEELVFDDATLNVSDVIASLKASYGAISAGSNTSHTVNVADLVITGGGGGSGSTPSPQPPQADLGMEIGSTRIKQLGDNYWQTVTFDEAITDAAVVMGPASSEGGDPLNVRVRNVTDTGFQFQIDEWDYLDGKHGEVSVSWMAGSVGSHTMADGTRVTFGQQDVTSAGQNTVNVAGFDDTPLVFAQLSGDNEDRSLIHRIYNVDNDSFNFVLHTEEDEMDNLSSIASEDLYWVALDIASGSSIFESGSLSLNHDYSQIGTTLQSNEAFFANIQSLHGGDTAGLRYDLGNNRSVSLRLEEEHSRDSETSHINERVSWFTANEGSFDFV